MESACWMGMAFGGGETPDWILYSLSDADILIAKIVDVGDMCK